MENNKILIASPIIVENGNYTRLEADTIWDYNGQHMEMTLFYEVESKWGGYLTSELSDSFVLPLIEVAMEKSCDILFKMPMSEDLKYQLEQYLIPIFGKKITGLHPINLIGESSNMKIESEGVVGTGFSGGVDSFYSVLSHINSGYESKKLTHLLLAVNGAANTGVSKDIDEKWFKTELDNFNPIVEEMGLQLIGVNSNVSLINQYKSYFIGGTVITTSGFVHALRKLFGTYYWASALEADVLEFNNADGGYIEPFTIPLLSVNGLRFYHSGSEVNRIEKVKYIADNKYAQRVLTVCAQPVSCGRCNKCLRTMAELNAVGKLDKYSGIFDINEYKKHYTSKLAREFAIDHPLFTKDIKKMMRKNGMSIPISVYFKQYIVFKPYYYLKKRLKHCKPLMNLYFLHGWNEKLGEPKLNPELIDARMKGFGKSGRL